MDEDDDTRSHTSIGSEPPSPPSGQITVTVAAAPPSTSTPQPPPQSSQSSLTLALPIQQFPRPLAILAPGGSGGSGGGGSGGGGGREDCWSEGATSVLIDAWGERYMELSRGNLKQKHWKEVADIVSSREDFTKVPKTDIQCKNRIDTVKKKYKVEKQKVVSGSGLSRWPFFDRLDRLIGPAAATPNSNTAKGLGPLSTATVSTGGPLPHGKAVPVGIPVGVRQHQQPLPLPFPPHYLQTPPHLQSPHPPLRPQQLQHHQRQQQQQLRQSLQFSPPSGIPQMRYSNNNNMNTPASAAAAAAAASNVNRLQQLEQIQKHQQQFRRVPPPVESDSDPEEWSHDSGDSLPPERTGFNQRKQPRMDGNMGGVRGKGMGKGKGKGKDRDKKAAVKVWGSSVRDLTRAIMKFGEAYEAAESAKLHHIVEMEMQRMKFAKELELQRMKFMMKTQLELSQLNGNNNASNNSDSRGGGGGGGGGSGGGVGGGESNHMNHAISDSSN